MEIKIKVWFDTIHPRDIHLKLRGLWLEIIFFCDLSIGGIVFLCVCVYVCVTSNNNT